MAGQDEVQQLRDHLARCHPAAIRERVRALHRLKLTNASALTEPASRAKLDATIAICNEYLKNLEEQDNAK
jgi:hypothetical protein